MKQFTFRRNTTPTIGATTLKKQKNLIKTLLLAVILLVGTGMVWSAESAYKTLTFSSSTMSTGVQNYTSSWTNTSDNFTWNIVNYNNNNKGWTYIRGGAKSTDWTGSITTSTAIDKPITKVVVNYTKITNLTSAILTVASNATFTTDVQTITLNPTAVGYTTYTIPTPTANQFYKLTCSVSKGANGNLEITDIVYYYNEVPASAYTVTFNAGTGSCGTASLTEASGGDGVTLPPASPSAGCGTETPAWVFAGWATASQSETTSAPTLYPSGSKYYPSAPVTLYAVYKKTTSGGSTETLLKTIGFESGESFTASTTYNNTTKNSQGPTGEKWDFIMGTPSTTSAIAGSQTAQMRSYASNTNIGSVTMNYDLAKVTKVTFQAKYSDGIPTPNCYYSTNNGSTWSIATPFTTTTTAQEFTFNISETGEYSSVRVKFENARINAASRLYIDDVKFYSMVYSSTTTYNSNPNCCTAITPTLSYGSYTVLVGNTLSVSNLNKGGSSGAVTYSSSNTSVLTVNSSTGVVTGVGSGTATVTASIAAASTYCAGSVESSTITVSSGCTAATTSFTLGTAVNKTFGDANFTNTFNSNNTGAKTYSSSNTAVATVNATTFEVTIVGVGSTDISVTQPETSGKCAVSTYYTLNVTCATLATPTGFTAGTVAATTIDFSWNAVPNASSYTIEYTAGSTQTKSGITGTSTQLTGLTPSTAYSITIQAIGNGTTYCSSAKSGAINVSTTAIPTYTLTWSVNGTTSPTTVNQGDAIGTLPSDPSAPTSCADKTFMGWTAAASVNADGSGITYISTATVPSGNTTYYAVFADETSGGSGDYELVTSTAGLEAGGIYTLASEGLAVAGYVLGDYAGGSNFPAAGVTVGAGPTIPAASVVSPLTLGGSTDAWTFEDKTTGDGYYLNPTSTTGSNTLKSLNAEDDYKYFTISFSSNQAVITNTGKASRNIVRYNGNDAANRLFSCYSSGQAAVYLYKKTAATTYSDFATSCCIAPATSFTNATVTKTDNDAAFTNALINGNVNTSTKAFTSSDPTVATVNATTGEVTILEAGTTTITLTQDADATHCAVNISYTLTVTNQIEKAWMQWPTSGSVRQGLPYVVYGKVYEPGVTDADGNGAVITAWIGYSSTNNNPNSGGWTWVAAPYSTRQGNDYEYKVDLGAVVTTPGTYYYAARFQIGTAPYVYGGYGTGYTFWNGTTSVNQQLIVTAASVQWANMQWPASGNCATGDAFNVYAQVYEPGITDAAGQGAGVQVWIGRVANNTTNPNTWDESAWVLATYNTGSSGNNDEYFANIATGLTPGTYYYASRIKLGAGAYQYGGYNGGFWNGFFGGSGNLSGRLVVNNATVQWCNLQSPASGGPINPSSTYNVYAQVYEPGVTPGAGQGDNIKVWIGYSTSNTDPSGWTDWVLASYNADVTGDNDEYMANIGSAIGSEGTYYYASRVQLGLGAYKYGGYNVGGGGFWDGITNVNGVLIVEKPKYTVTFDVGSGVAQTAVTQATFGGSVTLPSGAASAGCVAETPSWSFAGWSTTAITETTTTPTFIAAGTYTPTANITLYAVYKNTVGSGSTDATSETSFDSQNAAWTVVNSGGTTYWQILEDDYVLSPSFDLSTLTKVEIYMGTYGGTGADVLSIQDQSSNVWTTKQATSNKENTSYSITGGTTLSGTGKLKLVATPNPSNGVGLRIKSVKIYYSISSDVTTYNSNPICVVCDANTLAVTGPQTINLGSGGDAELEVSALLTTKNGNGAVTYAITSANAADAAIDENTGYFYTLDTGTYTVTISQALGSEAPTPICAKDVTLTITVLATPVVTIVDTTPLVFAANCGEASAAQSVSVSGYNLTANMTATAPTNFLVSSNNSTYGATATFTQTGGTASGTLYIKANPPQASTIPISGNVTLASTGATDRTLAVSATVSCSFVTVTFLDWDGTSTVWDTYYSGSTQTLPAPPRGACAGWTFSGWTTNNLTAISAGDIVGTTGASLTLTGSTTYYAVYTLEGSTGSTTDLIISEYVEGSKNNKYIEIYNGTGSSVDLSKYKLQLYANGSSAATEAALSGTLANNTTIVYKNNQAELTLPDGVTAITHTAVNFNGDDAIALYNTSTASYADIFGRIGNDPGSAWTGGGYTTLDKTLVRKSSVTGGITTSPNGTGPSAFTTLTTEWDMYNIDVVANLGSHTFAGGSTSYTLSPACCDINLVKPTVTTSSADESVTVSWPSVKDGGVEKATAYELTYKLASSSDDPTVVPVAATGAASYSQTIDGLTNCSNYVFTVEAIGDPEAATTICSSPIASVTTYPGVAHTVNYQYGAGTGTPNVWVSGCSNGPSTTLPAVTPNSLAYVFDGWYDGTTRVGGAGNSYTPTADVTLVAQYSAAPTYTLTFVNEGAEILTKTVYSTAAENDRKATEPNANYTDYGLELTPLTTACSEAVFVGWTTAETVAEGTTTSPTLVTFPYTISADATLYALWKIGDTDFVKVTSTPSDWSGDYVIVSGTKAMKNTLAATGEIGALDVTITSNTISNPDASIIWTFTNTGTDTYSAYNEAASKYAYITGDDSKKAGLSDNTQNLTIGFKTAGDYDQIQLISSVTTTRCFSYYSGSTTWRTYLTSGNSTGSLYRRVAGTTTYYSVPLCTPIITVDPADVATCISAADLVVAVGGTATSTGHTVAARNCSGTSIVPVITGTDRTAFSIDWTSKPLENGRVDAVYTVLYKPLTGSSHDAQLYFKTNDGIVLSDVIDLCGTVCTSALFTTQSSTQSSITFAWSAPLSGASLRVWNDITGSPSCGPMPYDQTTTLGTETSKTISGLSASTTFHYQITNGGCVSEVRNITTSAAVGLPVLTASPTLWETMAEANRAATYTSTTINLTGANMPLANVSIALRGETAAFTLVPSDDAITLDGNGAGSIGVKYNPVKPQTNIAYIDLTYTSDCETKTVTITLVGNVPGIDIVEVNPDASGFTLHTDLEGTPNIVLSQEVEHQGSGRQANDLFFSKYFEAAQNTKLLGLYNGTNETISLRDIRIAGQKAGELSGTKAALWNPTDIISLDTLQSLAPGKEIILFSTTSDDKDKLVINCVKGSTGWEHEGWYPVNDATAKAVYGDESRNLFINGTYENKNAGIVTSGTKVYGLQRKAVDGTWEFIDLIGAFHSTAEGDSVVGRQIKTSGTVPGMDAPGWACLNGTNYLTKETAGLSTNRHLLIRKNTVVDGLNALEQNTEDFATLCTEWEGLIVPKNGVGDLTEQEISCLHFGEVSTFNYDGYYASFERIDDNLVTFTAASGRPGDWVGSFLNPHDTFQDSLRCYNLKISVERYYDSRDVPPTERTKAYVQNLDPIGDAAEIAALDTVEVMSTQYRVPILVMNGDTLTTKDLRFTQLSKDTCRTCDVVVMNGGILTKSNLTDDRDSVRSVFVYNGGRLVVPVGLDYSIQDLSIRAQGDAVGAAYVEGNLLMKNPRIYHDKQIDNSKRYFFTLPYNCAVNKITEMNGKSLGVYGTTWIIQYYDGEQRIINRGLSSNWKMVPYDATLQAGRGYIIAITSDVQKYVRFPMVAEATFTEKNTAKTLDVTQYGELQASSGALGYNNVGWNLVGNPYISYFTSDGVSNDGVNNGTVELGGYYMRNSGGFNENTWTRLETSNIYVTIPNSNNVGYTQELASNTQLDPFISFFVQAQATGTLTFATTSRDTSPSLVAASANRTNETNTVALNLTVGSETDRTTILLDNYHTYSYEVGADLLKWKDSYNKLPYFYSFGGDNTPLAFNAINYDEAKSTIPVAFYMPTTGARYTFSIDRSRSNLEELEHVYLLRNGSNVADLLLADYTNTNLSRTQENKQFAISIQRAAEVVTPVNPTEDDLMMPRAITERHEVRVEQLPTEGSIVVLDAIGRTIANRRLTGDSSMTFNLPVDGVYTITVLTPARNYTLKTVIR